TFDQLAKRDDGRQQLAAIFVAAEVLQKVVRLAKTVVDGGDGRLRLRNHAGDAVAAAGEARREGLKAEQRILHRHLVLGDDLVGRAQRDADLLLCAQRLVLVGSERRDAVGI